MRALRATSMPEGHLGGRALNNPFAMAPRSASEEAGPAAQFSMKQIAQRARRTAFDFPLIRSPESTESLWNVSMIGSPAPTVVSMQQAASVRLGQRDRAVVKLQTRRQRALIGKYHMHAGCERDLQGCARCRPLSRRPGPDSKERDSPPSAPRRRRRRGARLGRDRSAPPRALLRARAINRFQRQPLRLEYRSPTDPLTPTTLRGRRAPGGLRSFPRAYGRSVPTLRGPRRSSAHAPPRRRELVELKCRVDEPLRADDIARVDHHGEIQFGRSLGNRDHVDPRRPESAEKVFAAIPGVPGPFRDRRPRRSPRPGAPRPPSISPRSISSRKARSRPAQARPAVASGTLKQIECSDDAWLMSDTETSCSKTRSRRTCGQRSPGIPSMPLPLSVSNAWPLRPAESALTGWARSVRRRKSSVPGALGSANGRIRIAMLLPATGIRGQRGCSTLSSVIGELRRPRCWYNWGMTRASGTTRGSAVGKAGHVLPQGDLARAQYAA